MIHSYYRKAKRFKLDEDLEVDDEFSTTKKRAAKSGWDFYDYKSGQWGVFGNSIRRFLAAQVGKNYSTVYSDFVKRAKNRDHEHFLRDRFHGIICNARIVDGVPYDIDKKYHSSAYPLSWGELYRDPTTDKICVSKVEKYKRKRYNNGIVEIKVNPDLEFVLGSIKYNKRVAPGVLVEVKNDVWIKKTRHHIMKTDYRWDRDEVGHRYMVTFRYPSIEWRKTTASKRELKQYKLKELQNDTNS